MRKTFEPQLTLGLTPIEEVEVPLKTKSHLSALIAALKHIYLTPKWNQQVFELLESHIGKGKKATGRTGMSYWEMFVLAQVKMCKNISYDELDHTANYDTLVRGIMGVLPTDFTLGKQYSYQTIYDNVNLLGEELLIKINDIIVEAGHEVFKKKEIVGHQDGASPSKIRCKTDSFVIEGDVHFPTDWNLLWDASRKCSEISHWLYEKGFIAGWQKHRNWKKAIKGLSRELGMINSGGGQNRQERLQKVVKKLLTKARALAQKVANSLITCSADTLMSIAKLIELEYFHKMLVKHIDLVDRRLLKGETISHLEKVFSLFQPHMEWINKGKRTTEIGKKLFVTTDQHHLIVDWQLGQNQADNQVTLDIASRLLEKYEVQSLSVDKGFSDKGDREILESYIPEVVMPKKGKKNKEEAEHESSPWFKALKNQHSTIESNINELEHRGLNRCKNRTWRTFKNYTALSVTAYNLHKIGRELQAQAREALKERQELAKAA